MKKSLLLIALVGILNKSVYSQILFNDDFTGQTTTGQGFGPPNTSLYETLESDLPKFQKALLRCRFRLEVR